MISRPNRQEHDFETPDAVQFDVAIGTFTGPTQ